MNEKLEAFRKRLREPEKKKTNWTSWIGSPTAQFATILSLYNLFYSHAYYNDELTVVLAQARIYRDGDDIDVTLPEVTLVNSGTRPTTVLKMHLRHVQPDSRFKGPLSCDDVELDRVSGVRGGYVSYPVPIVFERLVLKPGDAIVRSIKFEKNPIQFDFTVRESGKGGFQLNDFNQKRTDEHKRWLICLIFNVAAIDATWYKPVQLASDRDAGFNSDETASARHTLIKRNNFWTSVGPISQ